MSGYMLDSDHLFIKYQAELEDNGASHQDTIDAKQDWLDARSAIKTKYPKP
jgi:hypothetical protein